jgi:hypothetical protein
MNPCTRLLAIALALWSTSTGAEMVPVEWDAAGRFDKVVAVAPGKFVEACEKLPRGAEVAWQFEAGAAVDFNIHYHVGQQVVFPTRLNQQTRHEGRLQAELDQDYCWMWTNKGTATTSLRFQLLRKRTG